MLLGTLLLDMQEVKIKTHYNHAKSIARNPKTIIEINTKKKERYIDYKIRSIPKRSRERVQKTKARLKYWLDVFSL